MQIKDLRKLIKEELLSELSEPNIAEVVHSFCRDRNVEPKMRALGLDRLLDEPNMQDELENHLRASCLIGCKGEALDWLGLGLNKNPDTAEQRFRSPHMWSKYHKMGLDWFQNKALNCWGQPFFASAKEYQEARLQHPETVNMFDAADEIEIARTINEPSTTIWVPNETGGLKCVEGNKRLHALALGMVKGVVPEREVSKWQMWTRD